METFRWKVEKFIVDKKKSLTQPVRDPEGVVLRIVEGEDLVLRLLDQDVQPDGQVRADHVHQAETRDYAVTVNLHLLERDVLLLFYFIILLFYFIVSFYC